MMQAQSIVNYINHIYSTDGTRQSIDKLLKSEKKIIWENGLTNELGRLAQGINNITGSDTVDYIKNRMSQKVPP